MRVLWLCNCPLTDQDAGGTGTWLGALANGLLSSGSVELGIISSGSVKEFTRCDYGHVRQWLVPGKIRLGRDGLPHKEMVNSIVTTVKEFSPEIVHVLGTEGYWGLLTARGMLAYPSLLEIQGMKSQIAKVFYGGLTISEQLHCIGIKELLKRRTMHDDRYDFSQWGLREEEIIRNHRFIDVQSAWVAAHVKAVNPGAIQLSVELALRQPFYEQDGWQSDGHPTIFCTAAYTAPFKGLHVAIRALALLRKRIPEACLRIAGTHQRTGIRQEGYMRWINWMISRLGLENGVVWLGPLDACQIIVELKRASAVVIPTFTETYCMALAEAMMVGTPTVVAYTGGTAHLGKDESTSLFFQPGDEVMCAYQLERVLTDQTLAIQLSHESRKVATIRNDRNQLVQRQLDIYRKVLEEGK